MKKFTLYIPLYAGILCILLAFYTLIYTFGFQEPSLKTLILGLLIWTMFVLLAIFFIKEFIRDIRWLSYYEGYDDCKADLKRGPLKDMYEQYLKKLSNPII
jgi:hypothetical protein